MALADPMVGSAADRAKRICAEVRRFGALGVVISRIPGASHCAMEATIIGDVIRSQMDVPVVEIEVPPVTDAIEPGLRTRLEALVETIRQWPVVSGQWPDPDTDHWPPTTDH
jgi:benzoyl-CoA reductase/2-hydroxyglutaryl-CoA dehydratase subunit BcrC/BadD/HgdB